MLRFLQFIGIADSHEADEDVRLAEVSYAPGQGRNDADDTGRARVWHHVQQLRRIGGDAGHRFDGAADDDHADEGHEDDGQKHHAALDEVGPADGHEAAQEGVHDDDAGAEKQRREVIHAEDRFKQLPAGYEARRRINQEKDEDKYGRNDADQVLVVVEAVF